MESFNSIAEEKVKKLEINQIKSKNIFNNLKSRNIIKKIFNNIKRKISLYIVKYNRNIMKRINININDYKEYSEKFSSIEIEIKPSNNKYGKFIYFIKGK